MYLCSCCFYRYGDPPDLHLLTHSLPTRRSSDLVARPKIDLVAIAAVSRSGYPAHYASAVAGRYSQRLTRAAGLTDFGVNIITLEPGAWSSQRHWHETEDEFVIMLEGDAILVDDSGRTPMKPGEIGRASCRERVWQYV